jgi:hypothetical protein
MRVDVSGHQFVFPTTCACCNGKTDTELTVSASKSTGKRVIHTSTNAWDIPYCDHCVKHVKAVEAAVTLAWVLGVLSLTAAGALWYFATPFLGIPVGVAGLVGTVLLHNKLMADARAMCGPDCVCVERAVKYLGWHGPLHKFWIASLDHALAFMLANQKKLVNLSQEARDLLESSGHAPRPGAPRSPRRHRS